MSEGLEARKMGSREGWRGREDEAAEKGWGQFKTCPGKTLDFFTVVAYGEHSRKALVL